MLKSGMLTGATLKAAINIRRVDSDSEGSDDSSDEEEGKKDVTPGNPDDIEEATESIKRKSEEDKELYIL